MGTSVSAFVKVASVLRISVGCVPGMAVSGTATRTPPTVPVSSAFQIRPMRDRTVPVTGVVKLAAPLVWPQIR